MKFSIKDAIYLYTTINKIAENQDTANAPLDIKFLLVRNARALQPTLEDFENTRRDLIMKNSSQKGDNPDERQTTSEQSRFINSEIKRLEKIEVEVAIAPIPLSSLEPLKLNIEELNGLYPIITTNEEA